eukprot:3020201-Rhodomonas_salina.1
MRSTLSYIRLLLDSIPIPPTQASNELDSVSLLNRPMAFSIAALRTSRSLAFSVQLVQHRHSARWLQMPTTFAKTLL